MILTDAELERYARHIVLKEVGGAGQARLANAHVCVVGAGGIGSPVIQYLAAAGVGRLSIIDDDRIELSNLQRQTLFGTEDLGQSKAEVARHAVARLNPHVSVTVHQFRIDPANAAAAALKREIASGAAEKSATQRQ